MGNLILFSAIDGTETGTHHLDYALGSDLKSFTSLSSKDYSFDYSWGIGNVFPLYGVARRFGRVSIFAQGVGLVALQAGVRVSLHPLGPIAPHR